MKRTEVSWTGWYRTQGSAVQRACVGVRGTRLQAQGYSKTHISSVFSPEAPLALLWEGTTNGWFSCHCITNPHLKNCSDGLDVAKPTLMVGGTFKQQSDKEPSSGKRSSRPLLPTWLCLPWLT